MESVAKAKAAAAVASPLNPMKSPQKQGVDNTRRTSAIKMKFEKFLQALPQAENHFSDAARPSTEMVHLAPVGGRGASVQCVDPLARAPQNVDYYYGLTDMAGLTIQHVVRNKQRFVQKLCILKHNDFWDVAKWLAGACKSCCSHLDHQRKPVLIRDDKIKWLDFGQTPDPENSEPHPGFVWVKSGYSEAIAWRKVQLTKQRNVDLTTDSLWAMPLNTGWSPSPCGQGQQ